MYPLVEPRQRPERFLLNRFSPLAESPLLLGLGGFDAAGSVWYPDARRLLGSVPNDGTLTGMDPATDWSRDLGRAVLDFDGSNDYVDTSIVFTFPSAFSISGWVKPLNWANAWCGVNQRVSGRSAYGTGLAAWKAGSVFFFVDDNIDCSYSTGSTDARWLHVSGVYTGAGTILYVDGVQRDTGTDVPLACDTSFRIGPTGYQTGYLWGACQWADVCIHNRALSPCEVAALADPSNVMLEVGGVPLILPPRRVAFPAAVAEPSGFKPYWARNVNTLIGGGVS